LTYVVKDIPLNNNRKFLAVARCSLKNYKQKKLRQEIVNFRHLVDFVRVASV